MVDLEDGRYDVIVVDAVERDDHTMALELAVSSGAHRGDVVELIATNLQRSWMELLAAPGVLIVRDGRPQFRTD